MDSLLCWLPSKSIKWEKLGTLCIIDYKPRNLNDKDAQVLRELGTMVEHELSMVHIATNDDLTKINNRRGFMMLAQNNLEVCAQHGFPISLVYFDIDGFKSINDTHGHGEGDKVLITVANMIKDKFRASDVCARVSGDEFVVLLGNQDKNQAQESVEILQNLISVYNENSRNEYNISSYGIIEHNPLKHNSIKNMMNEGDQLMYENKKNKKNNVVQIAIKQKIAQLG